MTPSHIARIVLQLDKIRTNGMVIRHANRYINLQEISFRQGNRIPVTGPDAFPTCLLFDGSLCFFAAYALLKDP